MDLLADATGTPVRLPAAPCRVVSLVPSTTETVYALGGGDSLVGVTRYCVHPKEARLQHNVVGGTKSPRIEEVCALHPDLVLANQEENRPQDILEIRRFAPVFVAFPRDLPGAISDILALGHLLGRESQGSSIAEDLTGRLDELRRKARRARFRYLYLIWRNPYMAVGPGTFIDAMLGEAGGVNVLANRPGRYPTLEAQEISALVPDVVLLGSEPFPFAERHVDELLDSLEDRSRLEGRVLLVDGELLSWHGVRLRDGLPYALRLRERILARQSCAEG